MTEASPSTTSSDRALLRSIRAWGGDFARCSSRFSPDWRDRLASGWQAASREKPDASWNALRVDHEGSSRPDRSRVHPSWFVRALNAESPAVRLAVVAHAPRPLREALRRGLEIDPADLATDRPADPEALACTLALWSERIIGDVAGLEGDPPVVVALTRLGSVELARLLKVCGLVKHAFAIEGAGPTRADEAMARFADADRVRLGFFRRHIGAADPRLVPQARLDLGAIEGDRKRAHARVGLLTFGRLLESVEAHRARWAVQHLPYPIAKQMRTRRPSELSARAMLVWESWVLEAAWTRLLGEGRLTKAQRPGLPDRERGLVVSQEKGPDSWESALPLGRPSVDAGPLGILPSLTRRQVRLERRLGPNGSRIGPGGLLEGVGDLLGEELQADRFEVHWRAAGLRRPGVVAQLTWPRFSTRVGLGIEPPLAHALVDRLLGFERLPTEGRLQVTPVEWGILSFLMARSLDRLDEKPGPFGPWDLTIDRVGPDPFDPQGLGPIVTWRWRVRLGTTAASFRLWLPESLIALWLEDDFPAPSPDRDLRARYPDLSSEWRAEAGSIAMPRGLGRLHAGQLLLLDGSPLSGTPATPVGPIAVAQEDPNSRSEFRARAMPETQANRLILETPLRREPRPREALAMPLPADPLASLAPDSNPGPAHSQDVPVTLTVELGRVNLPLHRVADLKPGDVLELGRRPRDPVDLTSGGRLIARGELVQVNTELGVRVTQVFL